MPCNPRPMTVLTTSPVPKKDTSTKCFLLSMYVVYHLGLWLLPWETDYSLLGVVLWFRKRLGEGRAHPPFTPA